jgi:glucokinase
MSTNGHFAIGVDIGGTKVAAGLVNSGGEILRTTRKRMVVDRDAKDGLQSVLLALDEIMDDPRASRASGIGVSVPGWVDSRRGVLLSATNIPCWRNYPLAEEIRRRYDLRTQLANDANVAALAEAVWGAGDKYSKVFYVTLGTGIGTGIVLDRHLYYGRTGAAGEGGHMTIDYSGRKCGCGKRGCIERYASGTAIAQRARERVAQLGSGKSEMLKLAKNKIAAVTAEIVGKAALAGDPLANEVMIEAAGFLAIWLGNIIDLLEPEVIVIGGGVGQVMGSFVGHIRSGLATWAINPRAHQIDIRSALYGAESGLVGSAALCLPRARLWVASAGADDDRSGERKHTRTAEPARTKAARR